MKILVVCQYYYPEPFRITDMCEEMVRRGHEVTVVTGVPNYPEGIVYPGYKKRKKRHEEIAGVNVHRCLTIARRKGTIFRVLNYFSYAISSSIMMLSDKYKPADGGEFDVVFVNQLSPIVMAWPAMIYKKKYNKKIVMYCLDLWPESLVVGGIGRESRIYTFFNKLSKKVYKACDKILVTSRMFEPYITKRFDISSEKIAYLPQYAEELYGDVMTNKSTKSSIDLVFAGNIGEAQCVQTIVDAAEIFEKDRIDDRVRFHIVGNGSDLKRLKKIVDEKNLSNVIFYGRKPVEDMPQYYEMADAMLITLSADEVISLTLPGKVQSYMAAGKAIIGAINGETQIVIKEAECGFVGEADNSEMLVENIKKFIQLDTEEQKKLGNNAKKYYEQYFSRSTHMNQMEKWLFQYK